MLGKIFAEFSLLHETELIVSLSQSAVGVAVGEGGGGGDLVNNVLYPRYILCQEYCIPFSVKVRKVGFSS